MKNPRPRECTAPEPTRAGFQYLEDLATAFWYSEVLFSAIDLDLFDRIEKGMNRAETLARAAACRPDALSRLMRVLVRLELVHETDASGKKIWRNSPAARRFLLPESPDYLGDFLRYRRYLKPQWSDLTRQVAKEERALPPDLSRSDAYEKRTFFYVRAMDRLMRLKAENIGKWLDQEKWSGPVLDVGGGAGALCRRLLKNRDRRRGVLFELPEVLGAARRLYPEPENWERIIPLAGDFRNHPFVDNRLGLILMSNLLHTYGPEGAQRLLDAAVPLLREKGQLLIHDYFPDQRGPAPDKGPLYDLNMMLNTCEGHCHTAKSLCRWLVRAGMTPRWIRNLDSDTSVILAVKL